MRNKDNVVVNKRVAGLRIGHVNVVLMLISCILFAALIGVNARAYSAFEKLKSSTGDYMAGGQAALMMRDATDYLTDQVTLYTRTGDLEYLNNYFNEVQTNRRREVVMMRFQLVDVDQTLREEITRALKISKELEETEYYILKLVAVAEGVGGDDLPFALENVQLKEEDLKLSHDEMMSVASNMVFGSEYTDRKNEIYNNLDMLGERLTLVTEQRIEESAYEMSLFLEQQRIYTILMLVLIVALYGISTALVIRPLNLYLKGLNQGVAVDEVGAYEFRYLANQYNSMMKDIQRSSEELRYETEHDALTGAKNRKAFERIQGVLKDDDHPYALMLVDIDDFKTIETRYGFPVADLVLKRTYRVISDNFRSDDMIVRLGSNEFLILMSNMPMSLTGVIIRKTEAIRSALRNPDKDTPGITISAGIVFSQHGLPEDILSRADQVMYKVKRSGKDGYQIENGTYTEISSP